MENIEDFIINELLSDEDSSDSLDDGEEEVLEIILHELLDSSDSDDDEAVLGAVLHVLKEANDDEEILNALVNDDNIVEEFFYRKRQDNEIVNLNYFEEVIPRYNNSQFHSHFRMHRGTYIELENIVRPIIRHRENDIPLSKKLLLTLWIIATPESFRSVAHRFGLSKGKTWIIFKEVVWALKRLMREFIRWPNNAERKESERVFQIQSRGFPGVVGAIDGCHIPIAQPPRNTNDYYNREGFHSIVLQGVCDHTGKFIDCLIGRPGRVHDAAIFRSSIIYARLTDETNPLLPPQQHIIGDSAYPLLQNVMTPFRDNGNLTPEMSTYNTRLSSIRSIIERTFGMLKEKWRRLKYLDVKSTEMANHIIASACTLHNFLILHNEIEMNENFNFNENIEHENHSTDESDNDEFQDNNEQMKRQQIANRVQVQ